MEVKCCRTCKYLKKSDYVQDYYILNLINKNESSATYSPCLAEYQCGYPFPVMFALSSRAFPLDTGDFIGRDCPTWAGKDE